MLHVYFYSKFQNLFFIHLFSLFWTVLIRNISKSSLFNIGVDPGGMGGIYPPIFYLWDGQCDHPPMLTPQHGFLVQIILAFGHFNYDIAKFSALRATLIPFLFNIINFFTINWQSTHKIRWAPVTHIQSLHHQHYTSEIPYRPMSEFSQNFIKKYLPCSPNCTNGLSKMQNLSAFEGGTSPQTPSANNGASRRSSPRPRPPMLATSLRHCFSRNIKIKMGKSMFSGAYEKTTWAIFRSIREWDITNTGSKG